MKIHLKNKYNLAELCFYVFWVLLQVGKGLGYTSRDEEFLRLLVAAAPFVLVKLLLTKWDRKSLFKCVLLNLLGLVVAVRSGTTTYWLSIVCITAIKDMDIRKVLKINLAVRIPMFLLRTTLAIAGVIDIQMKYRYENGVVAAVRYGLGYGYPNTTQFDLFMLIVIFFLLYRGKTRIYHCLLAAGYSYFIFTYTNSRTPFILGIVFLAGVLLIGRERETILNGIIRFWSKKSWIIGTMFSVGGCAAYQYLRGFRSFGTFSSRFATALSVIKHNDLTLLGTAGVTTDLGYIYILYDAGIIVALLFFYAINKQLRESDRSGGLVLKWAFVCLAVFNVLEHTGYSVISNGLLLYLAYVVYPNMRTAEEVYDEKCGKLILNNH